MNILNGLLIVTIAGVMQGSFFLPMSYTKNWSWAHNWFAYSLLAMLIINWCIAFLTIDNIGSIIVSIPSNLLLPVLLFGLLWGAGAILFGIAMDMLGMALGYPIIMGINAITGAMIPALVFSSSIFFEIKGILIISGGIILVIGIIYCAKASSLKNTTQNQKKATSTGLILAIISGFTSCLPNIGAALSHDITRIAINHGVNKAIAGNVIWSLFFTTGSIVNMGYCMVLIIRKKEFHNFINENKLLNWSLILAMSIMWIGSFYAYGYGASILGNLGLIIGWPLLISLSIIIGNIWGIFRGEWKGATKRSKKMLNKGIIILILAIIIIAASNTY